MSLPSVTANGSSPPSTPPAAPITSTNLWAIEKFRDITPSMVIAIFDESLILEPGDVGPIPLAHPVARELVRCINNQTLTLPMLEKMREFGAPFYDGCVVVGIVDYRRWAFSSPTHSRSPDATISPGSVSNTVVTVSPEMHKVLLRPSYCTLAADIGSSATQGSIILECESADAKISTENIEALRLQVESKILVILTKPHLTLLDSSQPANLHRSQSPRLPSADHHKLRH